MKFSDALKWLRENEGRIAIKESLVDRDPTRLRWHHGELQRHVGWLSANRPQWARLTQISDVLMDADWQIVAREEPKTPSPSDNWTATPSELGAKDRVSGERRSWSFRFLDKRADRAEAEKVTGDLAARVAANPGAYPRTTRTLAKRLEEAERVIDDVGACFERLNKAKDVGGLLASLLIIAPPKIAGYRARWPKAGAAECAHKDGETLRTDIVAVCAKCGRERIAKKDVAGTTRTDIGAARPQYDPVAAVWNGPPGPSPTSPEGIQGRIEVFLDGAKHCGDAEFRMSVRDFLYHLSLDCKAAAREKKP